MAGSGRAPAQRRRRRGRGSWPRSDEAWPGGAIMIAHRRSCRTSDDGTTSEQEGSGVPHRFPALIAAPRAAEEPLWLTGARLFDGTGGPVREGVAVLIEDGVIRRVASAAEPCPAGARLIDAGQRMLMPGLIDAHTHT